MGDTIQKRRNTALNWQLLNPILADGEEGFETDTRRSKIGNGVSTWLELPYQYADVIPVPTANDLGKTPTVRSDGSVVWALGDSTLDFSYAELKALADNNNLSAGQRYRIQFISTVGALGGDGTIEYLVLTAETRSTFNIVAISELHPNDIVWYDLELNVITYRHYVTDAVEAYFDWRHLYVAEVRNEGELRGTSVIGISDELYPKLYPELPADQMVKVKMFHHATSPINVHIGELAGQGYPANVFFLGEYARKIELTSSFDWCHFYRNASDLSIGSCSSITCYGDGDSINMGSAQDVVLYANAQNITILDSANSTICHGHAIDTIFMIGGEFPGSLTRCTVLPSAVGPYSGDLVDKVLGNLVSIIDINYDELIALQGSWITGQQYRITDFCTTYIQPRTGIAKVCQYNADDLPADTSLYYEPIVVTAATPSKLQSVCRSEKFPQDIIHYSIDNIYGSTKGIITYRKDTGYNIEGPEDWRNLWYVRWSRTAQATITSTSEDTTGYPSIIHVGAFKVIICITERVVVGEDVVSGKFIWIPLGAHPNPQPSDFSEPIDIIWASPMHLAHNCYVIFNSGILEAVGTYFSITYEGNYWERSDSYETGVSYEFPMIPTPAILENRIKDVHIGTGKNSLTNNIIGLGWEGLSWGQSVAYQIWIGDWTTDCLLVGSNGSTRIEHNNGDIRLIDSTHCVVGMCDDSTFIERGMNINIGENSSANKITDSGDISIGNGSYNWDLSNCEGITIEDGLGGTDHAGLSNITFRRPTTSNQSLSEHNLTDVGAVSFKPETAITGQSGIITIPETSKYYKNETSWTDTDTITYNFTALPAAPTKIQLRIASAYTGKALAFQINGNAATVKTYGVAFAPITGKALIISIYWDGTTLHLMGSNEL